MGYKTVDLPASVQTAVGKLQAESDQLSKEASDLEKQSRKIRNRISEIENEIFEMSNPFKVGDIVRDEKEIEYRVTAIAKYGSPTGLMGIRLSDKGVEQYEKPRPIRSPQLTKMEGKI